MNAKGALITAGVQRSLNTLRNKVPMPGSRSDQGNPGDYAIDDEKLAIYVESIPGWMFFRGFEEES